VRFIAALIITILGHSGTPAQPRSADVSPRERQVLLEFFAATGGERWTKHDGWGSPSPVCDWYGVSCDFIDGDWSRASVAGLSLAFNNLEGEIPPSLADLPRLRLLDVTHNRLSGPVPEPLLERWDNYQFEFSGEGNAFANLVVRGAVEYSASGVLCAEHDDLQFRLEFDAISGRAVFQSVRCADAASRTTYCLVREGNAPVSLTRLSRGLKALGFARFRRQYDYPFTASTHGVYLTTTAVWGDRSRVSVETFDRQGPRRVWIAQQLFLGLATDASWERESRKPKCDFQK
jgi:hypothetical protein